MFCPNCGKNLPEEAGFCDNCGSSIAPSQPAPAQRSTYSPPSAPQSAYAPPSTYNPQGNTYQTQANVPHYASSNYEVDRTRPLTVGSYIGMFLLMLIPLANIILLFVWAFDGSTNINKKNWARAALIMAAIGIGLSILFTILTAATIGSFYSNFF